MQEKSEEKVRNSLRLIRESKGLSLAEVAKATEIPLSTLAHFETGAQGGMRSDPRRLKKLAEVLESTVEKILEIPRLNIHVTQAAPRRSGQILQEGGMPIRELCFDHIEKYLDEMQDEEERRSFLARLQQMFPLPSTVARIASKKIPFESQQVTSAAGSMLEEGTKPAPKKDKQ